MACATTVEDVYLAAALLVAGVLLVLLLVVWCRGRQLTEALCGRIFRQVDLDHSGTIDEAELYAAVLLVYHHINKVVRVQPPDREYLYVYFQELYVGQDPVLKTTRARKSFLAADKDKDHRKDRLSLSEAEFKRVMLVLVGNMSGRVASKVVMVLLAPLVAELLVAKLVELGAALFNAAEAATDLVGVTLALSPCQQRAVELAFPRLNRQLATTLATVALMAGLPRVVFGAIDRASAQARRKQKRA